MWQKQSDEYKRNGTTWNYKTSISIYSHLDLCTFPARINFSTWYSPLQIIFVKIKHLYKFLSKMSTIHLIGFRQENNWPCFVRFKPKIKHKYIIKLIHYLYFVMKCKPFFLNCLILFYFIILPHRINYK